MKKKKNCHQCGTNTPTLTIGKQSYTKTMWNMMAIDTNWRHHMAKTEQTMNTDKTQTFNEKHDTVNKRSTKQKQTQTHIAPTSIRKHLSPQLYRNNHTIAVIWCSYVMSCVTKVYMNITILSSLNQNWQHYSAAVWTVPERENTKERVWLCLNYCLENTYNCREFASTLQSHSASNIPLSKLQASSRAQHT